MIDDDEAKIIIQPLIKFISPIYTASNNLSIFGINNTQFQTLFLLYGPSKWLKISTFATPSCVQIQETDSWMSKKFSIVEITFKFPNYLST